MRQRPRVIIICIALLVLTALLIGQQTLSVPGDSRLATDTHNALHVPWFAAVTWTIWRLTGSWPQTLAVAVLLAAGSEAVQLLTGRTPSLGDLFANLLGMTAAVSASRLRGARSVAAGALPALGLLVVAIYTCWPVGMAIASQVYMQKHDWLLFDAQDPRGHYLALATADARLLNLQRPGLQLKLNARRWSGVHLRELDGLQKAYDDLVIALTVTENPELRLGVSMRFSGLRKPRSVVMQIAEGYHELVIPLERLTRGRAIDRAEDLFIYGYGEQRGRSFILHQVYLR